MRPDLLFLVSSQLNQKIKFGALALFWLSFAFKRGLRLCTQVSKYPYLSNSIRRLHHVLTADNQDLYDDMLMRQGQVKHGYPLRSSSQSTRGCQCVARDFNYRDL